MMWQELCAQNEGHQMGLDYTQGESPGTPWDHITRHLTSECWHRMVREAVTKTLTRLWVGVILIEALPGERLMGIFSSGGFPLLSGGGDEGVLGSKSSSCDLC